LKDVILVDNLVYSFAANLHNGILIKPFLGPGIDEELKFLSEALERWRPGVEAKHFIEREFGQREFFSHLNHNFSLN